MTLGGCSRDTCCTSVAVSAPDSGSGRSLLSAWGEGDLVTGAPPLMAVSGDIGRRVSRPDPSCAT